MRKPLVESAAVSSYVGNSPQASELVKRLKFLDVLLSGKNYMTDPKGVEGTIISSVSTYFSHNAQTYPTTFSQIQFIDCLR